MQDGPRRDVEIDKSSERIGELFDDISPTYDLLNHMLSMSIDVGWRRQTLDELKIDDGDVILDIASGTGDMAIMARTGTKCEIVGIDLSRNMLSTAVVKWGHRFDDDLYTALQGDALNMPFMDGHFDKAMVAFGIRNMTDIGAFLGEIRRVLRTGGRLAILEFSLPRYPVIRQGYLTYLTKILPFIGGLQSGNREAYSYLSESIRRFPSSESMETMFTEHGFQVVRSIPQTLGISHLYILEKSDRANMVHS